MSINSTAETIPCSFRALELHSKWFTKDSISHGYGDGFPSQVEDSIGMMRAIRICNFTAYSLAREKKKLPLH